MFSSKLIKRIFKDISALGALPFYLFLSFFVLLLGEIKLFVWLMAGLFLSYFITAIIRIIYHKDRPKKIDYKNFLEKIDASSFPSLHSWKIIMLSTLTGFYYRSVYLTVLLLFLSFLFLFSRYYLKKHYIIDIIFGGLFGLIEAIGIILFLPKI